MVYDVTAGPALDRGELYVGRTVCFTDIVNNPNKVGVLAKSTDGTAFAMWTATLNNVKYQFNEHGYEINHPVGTASAEDYRLHSVVTSVDLDITRSSADTRIDPETHEQITTTLSSLIPKDQFAIAAMQALIGTMPNAIAMDDATILLLSTKAYKIAQSMVYMGAQARHEDEESEQDPGASTGVVEVDPNSLLNNTEKLLNNVYRAIEGLKKSINDNGVSISGTISTNTTIVGTPNVNVANVPHVEVDNTPNVAVTNTPSVNVSNIPSVNINNTPHVEVDNTVDVNVTNYNTQNPMHTVIDNQVDVLVKNNIMTGAEFIPVVVRNTKNTPGYLRLTNPDTEPVPIKNVTPST